MLGGHKTEPMPFHDFLPSKAPLFGTVCPPHHFSHRKMRRASKGCCCLSASRMGLAQMGKMRNPKSADVFWLGVGSSLVDKTKDKALVSSSFRSSAAQLMFS